MSSSTVESLTSLVDWLNNNAFWRDDLVIKPSTFGGVGVFLEPQDEEDDPLLLRIPKSNLLASKNSFIYNLLVEYQDGKDEGSLISGMYSLIIAVIYEVSIQHKSPWFDYLKSIDFKSSSTPICLWDEKDKQNLANTEIDLKNLLKYDEIIEFYIECIQFAHTYSHIVEIPDVLNISADSLTIQTAFTKYHEKVLEFGQIIQSVISRAFKIDNFYDLALVPGADLFNHIDPVMSENKVVGRENIHFVCDAEVCETCGEDDCAHDEEDEDEEDEEENEDIEVDEEDASSETEDIDEDREDSEELKDSVSSSESSDEEEVDEEEQIQEEPEEVPITEITLEYIANMENELDCDSEAETVPEDGEVSTLSLSDDDNEDDQAEKSMSGANLDLAKELSDSSKCCDVVMMSLPTKEFGYEVFNSYGNEPNAYLLQRYGFITPKNVADSCLLSVQVFKHIKTLKSNISSEKVKQLEDKFDWFEAIGYDLINQLLDEEMHKDKKSCEKDTEDKNCEDTEAKGCEKDENCTDGCCDDHEDENEVPETWQLSPRIDFNGQCSPQTYIILKLIDLPYKIFKHKIVSVKKEKKLVQRVRELFISENNNEYNETIKKWCLQRLERYPTLVKSPNHKMIADLVSQEKSILKKFIES